MTENEEFSEACELASRLINIGSNAEDVAHGLNAAFEGSYFASKCIVYMRREIDYLPPRIVAKIA